MATPFLTKLEQFPPVRCRLAAVDYPSRSRYGWPVPRSDEQIQTASGLTAAEVHDMSMQTSWDHIPVAKVRAFLKGCRLDLGNYYQFKRVSRLANREKYDYLRRSPIWETQLKPLVTIWTYARRTP